MTRLITCKCCKSQISQKTLTCFQCGQPWPNQDDADIIVAFKSGNRLVAVQKLKELYKCTLQEAKVGIDQLASSGYFLS
jgi:hypothetical protein